MKRTLSIILLTTMFFTVWTPGLSAQGQPDVTIWMDGLPLKMDVLPLIESGRTLVPFRTIAQAMNIEVAWDEQSRTVYASDGETAIRLQIDNRTAYKNNNPFILDVAPRIVGGRTLIPLRFFSETFACKVDWDSLTGKITIITPPQTMTVIGFYALGDSQSSSWTNLFGEAYPDTATGNTDIVSELALGWYSIDREGNLLEQSRTGWQRPAGWQNVLESSQRYSMKNEMVIHVTDADGTITALLNDPTAVEQAVKGISSAAEQYDGVNLDFEGLGFRDGGEQLQQVQQSFTNFVNRLNRELKANDRRLTLTLHAPNSAYPGYDYRALGQIADRIIIMAYDYGIRPEPVEMIKNAVEIALDSVPAHKLVLGISAPSETSASIIAKLGIAKRYRLEGVALWRLGLISDGMWQSLRDSVAISA